MAEDACSDFDRWNCGETLVDIDRPRSKGGGWHVPWLAGIRLQHNLQEWFQK